MEQDGLWPACGRHSDSNSLAHGKLSRVNSPQRQPPGNRRVVSHVGRGLASNDRGEVIYLDVQPADVRHWLSEVDPAEIPVKGDHLTAAVGRWHRFAMSNYGLMGVASIERSPAGDILLDAAAEGAGLSIAADISRCYKTHRFRNGLPVYAGGPIAILEGSVCPEPAGERCVINLVRGVQPAWLAATLDRHQQLSRS